MKCPQCDDEMVQIEREIWNGRRWVTVTLYECVGCGFTTNTAP